MAMAAAAAATLLLAAGICPAGRKDDKRPTAVGEVYLGSDEFKLLDRLEAHALERADKVYNAKNWKQAKVEYESFLQEYPRSRVVPYVLVRIGRSLQLDDKRAAAARQYQEVLDYFPNLVRYAAPAIYFQGWCYWDSGEDDKAMKTWAAMARDSEYRKHELAATAINMLADNLVKNGKLEDAVRYYWQIAVDCRQSNRSAAEYARGKVLEYYYRTAPNEEQLRKFLREAYVYGTPRTTDEDLLGSADYWQYLRRNVRSYARFSDEEKPLKLRFFSYWAKTLDRPMFLNDDDYQLDIINFKLAAEGDTGAWIKRMDDLFERNQKKDDWGRIVRWMGLMVAHQDKCTEYYGKLNLPQLKMGQIVQVMQCLFAATKKATLLQPPYQQIRFEKCTNGEIVALMNFLWDTVGDAKWGTNVFFKLRLAEMADDDKAKLAQEMFKKGEDFAVVLCRSMKDKDRGQFVLLGLYAKAAKNENFRKKAFDLAEHCIRVPEYSRPSSWIKAGLLEMIRKYAEAILVYRTIDEMPKTLWAIARCYERMGKIDDAVRQLREIEGFFKSDSVRAATEIGHIYRRHSQLKLAEAAYRHVMMKYPESSGSAEVHLILEGMGVRIKGGIGAIKDHDNPTPTP